MSLFPFQPEVLERRRRELGMTLEQLSNRSGVSAPTVSRILSDGMTSVTPANTAAVASVLGVEVKFETKDSTLEIRRRAAEKKAREIVGLMQGTSGLEDEAVGSEAFERAVEETVHELMAGPAKRIWEPT